MTTVIDLDNISELTTENDKIINIGSSVDPITKPAVNFGPGIELLMNEKRSSASSPKSGEIKIDDIELLENELNDLSAEPLNITKSDNNSSNKEIPLKLDNKTLFNTKKDDSSSKPDSLSNNNSQPSIDEKKSNDVKSNNSGFGSKFKSMLGMSTANTEEHNEKTWDGYTKMNNAPINPDRTEEPKLSKEEELREKFKYLRKLEGLEKKGVTLTKKYDMESPLAEMQGEYEMIMNEKEKSNSIKFQGRMLMAAITGLEFLNNKVDPFDLKLDGWAEQVQENLTDYDEIFAELHEKYKSKATMAPELKLLFQLGGGAVMLHMTNTMFKSAMPGMDDIMKQNPELMQQFTQAAAASMSGNMSGGGGGTGFSDFMGDMLNKDINVAQGPPSPIETKHINMERTRAGNSSSRPDLNFAVNNNDGIDINNTTALNSNDSIGFKVNNNNQPKTKRNEMKGPSGDISEILAGLKTKSVDIGNDESSTISISELRDMQQTSLNKKRNKSDKNKNTVSLDI